MADRPQDRPRDEVAERRATVAADRIGKRHRGAGERAAAFVEEQRQAERPGPVSDMVRQAIAASGAGLRDLARQSGVSHAQLSRFMARERSLSLEAIDKLAPVLGLKVGFKVTRKRPKLGGAS